MWRSLATPSSPYVKQYPCHSFGKRTPAAVPRVLLDGTRLRADEGHDSTSSSTVCSRQPTETKVRDRGPRVSKSEGRLVPAIIRGGRPQATPRPSTRETTPSLEHCPASVLSRILLQRQGPRLSLACGSLTPGLGATAPPGASEKSRPLAVGHLGSETVPLPFEGPPAGPSIYLLPRAGVSRSWPSQPRRPPGLHLTRGALMLRRVRRDLRRTPAPPRAPRSRSTPSSPTSGKPPTSSAAARSAAPTG